MRIHRLKDELIFFGLIYLCLLFLLASCSTPETAQADTTRVWPRHGLRGTVNGQRFDGAAVIGRAQAYDIQIESQHDVGLFVLNSCHRSVEVAEPLHVDLFRKQKSFTYRYVPAPGIEDEGSCLVKIGIRQEEKNSWAVLDFITPEAALPATNFCNGIATDTSGVSICQARTGLVQMLDFEDDVIIVQHSEPRCGVALQGEAKRFQYYMPEGECVYAIMEKKRPFRVHRHTTVGWRAEDYP